MVKVRGRNSNGKTVKQTVKNGRKISGDDAARPAWVTGARRQQFAAASQFWSIPNLMPRSTVTRVWLTEWAHLGQLCGSLTSDSLFFFFFDNMIFTVHLNRLIDENTPLEQSTTETCLQKAYKYQKVTKISCDIGSRLEASWLDCVTLMSEMTIAVIVVSASCHHLTWADSGWSRISWFRRVTLRWLRGGTSVAPWRHKWSDVPVFSPSVWPSSRSNFDLGPSSSDSTEKNQKNHIRAYDFGVQFSFKYMLHPVAGRYPVAVILPIAVILYNIWWSYCKLSTFPHRPISSQPFSTGCHGNRNWRPIWKVAWWARVSCRRSRMNGIQCKIVQFCPVIPNSTAFFLPEPVSCRGQRIARSKGASHKFAVFF